MKLIYFLFILTLFSFTPSDHTTELDRLMTLWHQAATDADFENYFGLMDENFVFLGTAPEERWKKDEFAAFSKPYFDKGKAWDFKASNRIWMFSEDNKTAWFDEDLETWMKGCRGSGVFVKTENGWKIAYYNLTVLIENEKMNDFIELRESKSE